MGNTMEITGYGRDREDKGEDHIIWKGIIKETTSWEGLVTRWLYHEGHHVMG